MSDRFEKLPRTVLPIPDRPHVGLTTYDARDPDTKYPPIEPLRPPEGAPNMLIVLIDDVGFGASSAFGGPCHTPNFERLAASGLRYNRFHSGGITGGWSLYAKAGKLKHCYNFFGLNYYYVESQRAIPSGTHQVRMEFAYDGGGLAKGGNVTLYIDGAKVGEGWVEQTEPFLFSADETCDIGTENGSPVTNDYSVRKFTGEVNWVEIDLGADAAEADHFIKPEERLHLAMAIQ